METQELCKTCHGALWLRYDVPFGHQQFGKIAPCPDCMGVYHLRAAKLEQLGIAPGDLLDASWLTFPPGMDTTALHITQDYVEEVRKGGKGAPRGLILAGVNQIGKTGLAWCAHRALKDGRDRQWRESSRITVGSVFITTAALIEAIRVAKMDDNDLTRYTRLITDYGSVPHLVIDDLGAQRLNESRLESLFDLIDRRMTQPRLATIITTNLEKEELRAVVGDRIWYRFIGRMRWQSVQGSAGLLVKGA